jgi:hypothetical protein
VNARHAVTAAFVAFALTFAKGSAQAQVGLMSADAPVPLAATKEGTLTITVQSGGTQTLPSIVTGAVNDFATPVQVMTQWNVNPGRTGSVNLVAYFTTPNQALSNGSTHIPSSRLYTRVAGPAATFVQTTFAPISGAPVAGGAVSVGTAGGTLLLWSLNIGGGNRNSSRVDNLYLRLDLTGHPELPAGNYTGTLHLRAITQ